MAAVADMIREARLARRVSVNQAALETRIRQSILESLEEGDYASLPPRPFLRGLLRNYAVYLNLDPDDVLDEYDVETGARAARRIKPPPAEPQPPIAPPVAFTPPQSNPYTSQLPPTNPYTSSSPQANPYTATPPSQPNSYAATPPPQSNPYAATPPPQAETYAPETQEPEVYPFPPFEIANSTTAARDYDEPEAGQASEENDGSNYELTQQVPVPPPTMPLNLPQEPPTLGQRIGSTRIPEIVAILAIAIALFMLVSQGFTQVQQFINPLASQPTAGPSMTASPTIPAGSTPTGIPTLLQTGVAPTTVAIVPTVALSQTLTAVATSNVISPSVTATFEIPADASMTLEIESTVGPMGVWVIVDEESVFNGTLTSESKTYIAHARMYVQIKNIENGRVFFQGTRILPRNQEERSELNRGWLINPLGTPVIVPPTPYPSPVTATTAPSLTPTPSNTPTRTSTLTTTPTSTATGTATATVTSSLTPTASTTATASSTATASPTATASRTSTTTRTLTATASATASRTLTRTATATATCTATSTRTTTSITRTFTPAGGTPTATRTVTRTSTPTPTSPLAVATLIRPC